jgi:hypothetical protein
MAYQAHTHVIGLHLNLIYVPPPNQEAVAKMIDAEPKRYSYFDREEGSFFFLQASEPQTLAYALTDSPVGWLAWMIGSAVRIYREDRLTREEMVPTRHLETPVGYADFPKEVAVAPFSWITQTHNIVQKLACRRADTSRLWSSPTSWLPIYGSSLQRLIRSTPNLHPDTKYMRDRRFHADIGEI